MIVATAIKPKTVGELQPGELVRIRLATSNVMAIVLRTGSETSLLGLLEEVAGLTSAFTHRPLDNSLKCVSYGLNWVLEPELDADSWYGNRKFVNIPGALHLAAEGWFLCFGAAPNSTSTELDFNLSTHEVGDVEKAVPSTSWKLWEDEACRSRPGSEPLFVHA